VDDHEATRRALGSLLSSRPGWLICGEAVDGVDAVEKAKAYRPDVVLMDISMPRMTGLDATRIIRRDLPESKVIIVSQNDPAIVDIQAREVDASAHIAKDNLNQDLFPTLENVMNHRKSAPAENSGKNENAPPPSGWVAGSGEMARLIREKDWSRTSLGPLEAWPQSLKIAVNLMLNSRHAMWVGWGKEMPFLYNDAYISVLGLAKHPEALGRPTQEVWQEIWNICGPLAEKVFEKGEATFADDVRFFMNRGTFLEEIYVSFSYNPIYDESGNIAGLFCANTETTPKILNARRLQTLSELAAKALVERSAEAACASCFLTLAKNPADIPFALLYLLDAEGAHAFFEQSTGVSGDIHRMCPTQIDLDEKSTESSFWRMNEILDSGRSRIVSLKNLESVPLGAAGQPLAEAIVLPVASGRQDRPIGILIAGINPARKLDSEYQTFYELLAGQVATAIQNARAAEEDRKRADALAEIDRAKTVFFNNVSHEFRTPLTLMLGPVEDLLSRSHTDLSPSAKNQLELVNRNGSRLLRLVNTLLDFSRIEAGRMQAVYQPTDLPAFTVELASVFRSATEKAGLRLELDCPKLEQPVFVDRDMWEKIVLNLISNAFKFTFEGEIAISLRQEGNSVELRVRDTGVGIPANELPRLFDRFHRVQNARSRTHEGSGIGLAFVQELVKLHGGAVRVESVAGKGSTFIVSLPLGSAHLPADRIGGGRSLASTAVGATPFLQEALGWLPGGENASPKDELPLGFELLQVPCPPIFENGDPSLDRPRVLIADDNADMRQYLVRLLAERYSVKAVPNGKAALEAVAERTPDLILSDVMMPELDGFGLLRELRSDPKTKTIPIILLSARAGEESRVEGMEHGADDYLIKPFSVRELLARVQTHLEMSRVRKQAEDALREKERRLRLATEAAQLGIWHWYLGDDRATWENDRPYEIFGRTREDGPINGAEFKANIVHPDDAKAYDHAVSQMLQTGGRFFFQGRIRRKNGSTGWVEFTGQLEYKADGTPWRVLGTVLDITERKEIEERERRTAAEAIAATAKFRAVFEQSAVFAGIMTLDGIVIDANRLSLEACGYRQDEVLGRLFWETGWWRASGEVQAKIRAGTEQAAKGIPYTETLPYHWADGTQRIVEFGLHPILNAEGQVIFLHLTGMDVTERKQAERTTGLLAAIVDSSDDAIISKNLDGFITSWNRGAERVFGYTEEEAVGRNITLIIPPERRDEETSILNQLKRGERVEPFETLRMRKDGTTRDISISISPVKDGAGRVVGASKVARDITERKRIEKALRESEERFRAIVETSPECVKLVAFDGTLLHMNSSGLAMVGADCAETVVGKNVYDIIAPQDRETFRNFNERICRGEKDVLEFEIVSLSGVVRRMETHAAPLQIADGTVVQLAVTRDITERTRAEEELRRSEEKLRTLAGELESQVRSRTGELELRSAEILQQSEQLRDLSKRLLQAQDQERRHIARELHDSAGQIVTVLGINLARIAQRAWQNGPQVAQDVEDCRQLANQLSQEIRTTSYLLYPPLLDETGLHQALSWYIEGLRQRSGLQITLSISKNFGRLPREMELVVYRLVQECLTNIHRHSGSKSASIRLARAGEIVSLEIQDAGRGIPPEKLKLLQLQGAGVGIRGMIERVRQFNGEMDIKSDGGGASVSFIFHVPAAPVHSPESLDQQVRAPS
jgi:PAS domain S-box-containing protein